MKDYSNYYPSSKEFLCDSGDILFNIQQQNGLGEGFIATIDGISSNIIIQQSTNPYNESKEDRTLLCLNSTAIHRGSIVIYTEDSITKTHIVMTDIDTNGIYKSCKIQKCNNVLTFKSATGAIATYPCILVSDSYALSNLNESKYFITQDNKRTLYVPYNADTKELFLQERLMFNHEDLYKINSIDHDSYFCNFDGEISEGVLKIILESVVEIVGSDDKINNLAYNENSPEIIPIPTGKLIINGENTLMVGNINKAFTLAYDNGGVITDTFTFTIDDTNVAKIISTVGLTCYVNAIGSGQCKLTATDKVFNTITASIILTINESW